MGYDVKVNFREDQRIVSEATKLANAQGSGLAVVLRKLLRHWIVQQRTTALMQDHADYLKVRGTDDEAHP